MWRSLPWPARPVTVALPCGWVNSVRFYWARIILVQRAPAKNLGYFEK